MYLGVIARRYATALADCAVQRDEESHAFDEAGQLLEAMKDNIQLRQAVVFSNPSWRCQVGYAQAGIQETYVQCA